MFHETSTVYDIPLNHFDFQYITNCNKLKELEKIYKVLKSGVEGRYPDLEKHCEEKIRSIDPENRLLRKPGVLLSARQLPDDEREEVETGFQEWLEETKQREVASDNAYCTHDLDEDIENNIFPNVRQWGSINVCTGKGTRVQSTKAKGGKQRTYEEWDKIGKEIERELEEDEKKTKETAESNGGGDEVSKVPQETSAAKPSCKGLRERVRTLPSHIRSVYAQREKEKGNEALIAGDYNEALGYYERSLVYEETTAVYNNRALLYLKQKKWKLSVADCGRVLSEEPENVKALLRRAQALYELHSLEKAQTDLELVLKLEPQNTRATKLLEQVREEHAKRQKSNLEGGRRMVIQEVDDDDEEGEEEEDHSESCSRPEETQEPQTSPPQIKRGVEIEEVFDSDDDEDEGKRNHSKGAWVKPEPPKSEVKRNRSASITKEAPVDLKGSSTTPDSGTCTKRYKEIIEDLKSKNLVKLKAALDVQLDARTLEDYIFALREISLRQGDYNFIYGVLDTISRCSRFKVATLMLDCAAFTSLEEIFLKLQSSPAANSYNLTELKNRFVS